ncbi:MAG: Hpt domain-containing protein [Treponema sp.]|jgi:HPt (histidine-containing phosphotransfer) domain-containing protein|nr:Hpt domain-containing protein [Treponema sp.]
MADDVVYVNVEDGSKRVMNNIKLYVKLLAKFKDDQSLPAIETAIAEESIEKAQPLVHTLKGLSANLSLTELFNQTLELETQMKAGTINRDQLTLVKDIHSKTLAEIDKVISKYGG